MHETILNQISGNEQPHEEVQLTELVPVKQSCIRENSIFKDADTTDALKVLRSFTDSCNDNSEFNAQSFDFCDKIGNANKQEIKSHHVKNQRKGNGKGENATDSIEQRKKEKPSKRTSDGEKVKRSGRRRAVGNLIPSRRQMKILKSKTNLALKDSIDKNGNREDLVGEEDMSPEYSQDDETTYLDLDKTRDFKDEVYVFRQDTNFERNSDLENSIPLNDYSTTDGTLFSHKSSSKNIHDTIDDKDKEEHSKTDNNVDSTLDDSSKELSLNIDAIIQANYLLEQDNNNCMSPKQDKLQETSTTPTSESSTLTEGFNSSSGEENSNSRKTSEAGDQENQQKKYCCVVCDAKFKGSGGLRNHYKIVHGAGPIFKCDECGKEFPLKERLKLHVRTHTGFKPYKCPECDKSFARGGQLVQHRRTHSQVKPYRCTLCSGTFTCAANLALHVKRHNGQKDHKCEICGRAFVRRDALKKHLECLHRDVKSFLCVICNKTFKGHLPQHMRTHARDRPHGCATCGQRFAQKSQLTVHQRTHSGQRPFRCLVCWQAFAHSTALKLHTRRHTGERPFKCAECNAGFTQLPHWKKHMKCIHGRNEPYGCKKCKSFFRIKNDLESHEKTCHPETEGVTEGVTSTDLIANETTEKGPPPAKYRVMTVERMRLLLAVLLKRISRQERLDELGFGKRLIDEVLQDSLISAGKDPATGEGLTELEALTKNLEIFLEWTVPKEHWENFQRLKKTPEDILETLTAT